MFGEIGRCVSQFRRITCPFGKMRFEILLVASSPFPELQVAPTVRLGPFPQGFRPGFHIGFRYSLTRVTCIPGLCYVQTRSLSNACLIPVWYEKEGGPVRPFLEKAAGTYFLFYYLCYNVLFSFPDGYRLVRGIVLRCQPRCTHNGNAGKE